MAACAQQRVVAADRRAAKIHTGVAEQDVPSRPAVELIVATGAGAAALGHPANAVAWLANTLGRLGIALEAGEVVLSGSLGIMVPVQAGDNLRVTIGGIGGCSVRFV